MTKLRPLVKCREGDIVGPTIAALNATYRCFVWRWQSSGKGRVRVKGGWMQLAPAGCPDIGGFMLRDGRVLAIEVKKPGPASQTASERRLAQEEWGRLITSAGGVWGRVESVQAAVDLVMQAARR